MRSEASEEPQQPHAHGRSTRAANRGTTNGRGLERTAMSDDEEDATSWDGGDEDEDEPDQMDVDDDEDEQAEDSSEEESEPPTLMVTLRYRKGSLNPPNPSNNGPRSNDHAQNAIPSNGSVQESAHTTGMLLAGHGAPRQPEQHVPAPIEPPLQPAPLPQPVAAFSAPNPPAVFVPNGIPILSQQPLPAPVAPIGQYPQPAGNPTVLPKLDGMFPAPNPTYNALPASQQQPAQYPVTATTQQQPSATYPAPAPAQQQPPFPPQQQQKPFVPTLPPPTPATNWQ